MPERKYDGLEIAVIGMSCRFPGSANWQEYWQHLKAGRLLVKTYSDAELREAGVPDELLMNSSYVKAAAVVNDKDRFDPAFFGYTDAEAQLMDPQIRLFHEQCWSALEDAGYASAAGRMKTGLFTGASENAVWKLYAHSQAGNKPVDPFFLNVISTQNFISSLVSYRLNLRGPSIYVDTACSTSLAAVHLAARSLITRECALALAGGVSLKPAKQKGYLYREGMAASKDGYCHTFDAEACGTGTGEGAGVVVLKRLADALRDRDNIYAVIRATAANNDGNAKIGYTAPSVKGQAECIAAAMRQAGVKPETIGCIEAHGTATKLGDPVEVRALAEAFAGSGTDKFCAIGSVKTNMGHLDAAAGVAGLIKAVLSLKYRQLVPSLFFKAPNPEIDFGSTPFYVNTVLQDWQPGAGGLLRAGVSSLGIGGTNVHAVLEEAPPVQAADSGRKHQLLLLSARTGQSLTRYAADLKKFLSENPGIDTADMAYTLQTGRKHFACRAAAVYSSAGELMQLLSADGGMPHISRGTESVSNIVFLFPGQGAQYPGMLRGLYDGSDFFRSKMEEGFAIAEKITGHDFRKVIFSEGADARQQVLLQNTAFTQPLIFLAEYCIAAWLISVGIKPCCMAGHSIGEYTAACISGVFSFEDALRLVTKRGALMSSLPGGSMISVAAGEAEVRQYLSAEVSLAAVNSPAQSVLSGNDAAIEALARKLEAAGIPSVKLRTSHAFHSYMLGPVLEAFHTELEKISFNRPGIPFVSNLTGAFIREEEACSPAYWVKHMRETVRFADGLQSVLSRYSRTVFAEAGPGHSLGAMLKQLAPEQVCISLMRTAKETTADEQHLAAALGRLWMNGADIDWQSYYGPEKRNRISLPSYSFERIKYPAEVDVYSRDFAAAFHHASANSSSKSSLYFPVWRRQHLLSDTGGGSKRLCLLLSGDEAFTAAVKPWLGRYWQQVVEVYPDAAVNHAGEYDFAAAAGSAEGMKQLLDKLEGSFEEGLTVIYAWGINASDAQAAFYTAESAVKALLGKDVLQRARIALVTAGLYRVTGAEQPAAEQGMLPGLFNALQQEQQVTCFGIDIESGAEISAVAPLLAYEAAYNTGVAGMRITALRGGFRWVQDYQQNEQPLEGQQSVLKKNGVYLITGGLGNAGYVIARYLVNKYDAAVVLTGRTVTDNAADDDKGPVAAKAKRRLAALRSLSSRVHYHAVDIARPGALEALADFTENTIGAVNGVIHTAGVMDRACFEAAGTLTAGKAEMIFAPKVAGIRNIYTAFRERKPDFVWVISSISALLGGLGFSAYGATNLYMDHFVSARCAELPGWKCVDFSGLPAGEGDTLENEAALLQVFEWSLSVQGLPVIIQSPENLYARLDRAYSTPVQQATAEPAANEVQQVFVQQRPDLSVPFKEAQTDTEKILKRLFEEFFSMEKIGVEDVFFELGGDSLKGMMLLKRINKECGTVISIADFMAAPTIRQLALKIEETTPVAHSGELENEMTI